MSSPYTLNTGKLSRFLDHIQAAGVPGRFNQSYLKATEFKSSNDRALISIMKYIGFTDDTGKPTEKWQAYRDRSQAGRVLASGLREGYSELFNMYPDANKQTVDTVRNFMASKSSVGDKALSAMVTTFRSLCERADFDADSVDHEEAASGLGGSHGSEGVSAIRSRQHQHADAVVTININLTIEPTNDASVYDSFFSAMRKHLIDCND